MQAIKLARVLIRVKARQNTCASCRKFCAWLSRSEPQLKAACEPAEPRCTCRIGYECSQHRKMMSYIYDVAVAFTLSYAQRFLLV